MTRDDPISNTFNSTVPIAAEDFKKAGTYDTKRPLGVTMLDVTRANTFVEEVQGLDPREVDVPIVGGHAEVTILPLLSQYVVKPTELCTLCFDYFQAEVGAGSATLSMMCNAAMSK